MKNGLILFWLHFSAVGFSQSDTIYNYYCNDQWLDELIKTDSISEENKRQDYMCYLGIFDSLNRKTKYSQLELLKVVGKLTDFADGAFSEGLFYSAFEYVYSNPDLFFTTMNPASSTDIQRWVKMIYYEYSMRSASEAPFAEFIIRELELIFKQEKPRSWNKFKESLFEFEKEHIEQLREYYENKN